MISLDYLRFSQSQGGEVMTIPIKRVLSYAMDIGEAMLVSGAGVSRVEDTVMRICNSYGAVSTDVYSITTSIVASTKDQDGQVYTQTRRVYDYKTDFFRLDQLNQLSRTICSSCPEEDYVKSELERIYQLEVCPSYKVVAVSAVIAGAFAFLFGGGVSEALIAFFAGGLVIFIQLRLKQYTSNEMFLNFVSAGIVSSVAYLVAQTGFAPNYGNVIIGNIMLLVPGVTFVNALRDMIGGDMMSGILKVCESILLAVFLAGGSFAALVFWGGVLA